MTGRGSQLGLILIVTPSCVSQQRRVNNNVSCQSATGKQGQGLGLDHLRKVHSIKEGVGMLLAPVGCKVEAPRGQEQLTLLNVSFSGRTKFCGDCGGWRSPQCASARALDAANFGLEDALVPGALGGLCTTLSCSVVGSSSEFREDHMLEQQDLGCFGWTR